MRKALGSALLVARAIAWNSVVARSTISSSGGQGSIEPRQRFPLAVLALSVYPFFGERSTHAQSS